MELTLWPVCTWYVPIVSLVLHRWMFDWLRKFAPTFQPIKYKSKISHDLVARVFPRLRKCAWLYLNLSWRIRNSYLLIDRSNYFCFGLTTVYQKALYLCKFWLEFYILSDRFPCVDRLGRMVWIFFLVIICGCCLCFFALTQQTANNISWYLRRTLDDRPLPCSKSPCLQNEAWCITRKEV